MPACRGPAVSGARTVIQWPIVVAACITVHRVQGVGFERVALWIPLRVFFTQGQGHTAVARAQSLKGLPIVVLLDAAVAQNREDAKTFLKDAFQPPLDAIKALDDMRARAPATVELGTGGKIVKYAELWNSRKAYLSPALWIGVWITNTQPQGTYALNS